MKFLRGVIEGGKGCVLFSWLGCCKLEVAILRVGLY